MKQSKSKIGMTVVLALAIFPFGLMAGYVFSILWRVSVGEQELFGRSYLLPLTGHPPQLKEPPVADSYGDGTYTYVRGGRPLKVYKQLTNGFQHAYASALAAYEIGEWPADLLFRANEYSEAVFCRNAATTEFYLDTKKDLANNAAGRKIGVLARSQDLHGAAVEHFLQDKVLQAMADGQIFTHYREPGIANLPSFDKYGCPLLAAVQKKRL